MARILVVDDEQGIRHVLAQLFEYEDHEVRAAGGGAEALAEVVALRERGAVVTVLATELVPALEDLVDRGLVARGADVTEPELVAAARLVVDGRRHGPNGKISNLMNMAPSIRHEIVVLADETADPAHGGWEPVCDFGFGDSNNKTIFEMEGFGDHLYVGTFNLEGYQIWRSTCEGEPPRLETTLPVPRQARHSLSAAAVSSALTKRGA